MNLAKMFKSEGRVTQKWSGDDPENHLDRYNLCVF